MICPYVCLWWFEQYCTCFIFSAKVTGVPGAVSVEQAERTVEIKWRAELLAVRHLNISYLMNVFSVFIGQSSYCPVPLTAERFGLWSIACFIGGSVLDHPVVFVPWSLSCQRKGRAVEDRVQPNLSPLSWSLLSYAAKPHFQLFSSSFLHWELLCLSRNINKHSLAIQFVQLLPAC